MGDGAADGTSEGELGVELEAAGRGSGRGGLARHDEDCVKKNKIYLKHRRKKDGRIHFQQKEWGWDEEGWKTKQLKAFLWQRKRRRRKEEKETERDGPERRATRAGCAGRSGNFSHLPSITLSYTGGTGIPTAGILDGNAVVWTPVMDSGLASDAELRCDRGRRILANPAVGLSTIRLLGCRQ